MIDSSLEQVLEKDGFIISPIKGTSMTPLLKENVDRVVIKKLEKTIKKGDVLLYKRPNGAYILHRVYKATPNFLVMCGDNHLTLEYNVKYEAVLGVLTGVYKQDKFIDLEKSFKYKIYKNFYGNNRFIRLCAFKIRNAKIKLMKLFKKG
ncbi:MAG: S24/S26 family peptidase [Clostridia bacterium]|nr:S24/S26 family peptidase [Clostridia bacterium]